jgi:hypothetical protein
MKTLRSLWLCCVFVTGGILTAAEPPPAAQVKGPTQHQKIYFFEHRLLPKWVHHSKGAFFEDLASGSTTKMVEAATEIVGKDFADALHVEVAQRGKIILLLFPKPNKTAECYFAAVIKTSSGYRYLTLEADEDIMKQGVKAFYCEWTSSGAHLDFGPRRYDDEADFLTEVTKEKNDASTAVGATFVPPSENPKAGNTAAGH